MKQIKYFEKFGLVENPFYSEPVGEFEESPKGFINRERYLSQISMLLDDGRGYIKFVGEVGVGKTSLLKRAKFLARKKDYAVIEVNANEHYRFIDFYSFMIYSFKQALDEKQVSTTLTETQYEEFEKVLKYQLDKIQEEFTQHKAEMIKRVLNYLETIFAKRNFLIIADDSDKLGIDNFKIFIECLKSMPRNIVFISTAHPTHLTEDLTPEIQKIYDHYPTLEPINSAEELAKYVNGRIENYSKIKTKLFLGKAVFEVLFERTRGNLRETFRYLRTLLKYLSSLSKDEHNELTDANIKKIIREEDATILNSLKPMDLLVLSCLSEGETDIAEITKKFNSEQGTNYSEDTIRKRLDYLAQLNFVFKKQVTGTRGHKINYSVSQIVSEIVFLQHEV